MFEQARTSHSNNLGFFGHIKTDYSGRTQFFDWKVGINILSPARAKVRTSSARNVMHLEQIIISSRMSAPGISCSKEAVLRIGFMFDHHRNY